MIKVKVFAVNPFREATYVVSDSTGEAVVIDCGLQTEKEIDRFDDYIKRNKLKLTLAINTHCHIDHILGVEYVKEHYKVPFAASLKEEQLLLSGKQSAMVYGIAPPTDLVDKIDIDLDGLKEITFGDTTLRIIPTPGHTKGGVCFYEPESKTLFTGDTLFKGSIGRTDLPGGSYPELMDSIIEQLLPLDSGSSKGDVVIYPGHGDHSTLTDERLNNPFIGDVLNGDVKYK